MTSNNLLGWGLKHLPGGRFECFSVGGLVVRIMKGSQRSSEFVGEGHEWMLGEGECA